MIFHIALKKNYYFIIKKLPKEFEKEFNCLGENAKQYKLSSSSNKRS